MKNTLYLSKLYTVIISIFCGEAHNHETQHAGLARQLCANILKVLALISPILGVAKVFRTFYGNILRLLYKDTHFGGYVCIYIYIYVWLYVNL